jgi:hypothetical protein
MKTTLHSLIVAGIALLCAPLAIGCGEDNPAVDAAPLPDAPPEVGTLSLSWSILDGATPLTCDQIGGISVSVTARPQDGGFEVPESFGCATRGGTSAPIAAGVYNVEVVLVTGGSRELTTPETIQSVEIVTGQDTPLGAFEFQVTPRGAVEFTLDAQEAPGNCEDVANGGAGITEFFIEVLDADGACVPLTAAIADGAAQTGGSYTLDCLGARYACIDSDQVVRIEEIPSGTASLNIIGYRGADECYTRAPQFSISGNGLLTELSPQALTGVGPCAPAP